MDLKDFFRENPRAALGFSGGVDSSYLLCAGLACGADIKPYFIKTDFQPAFELEDARRLTEQFGAKLTVLEYDVLAHRRVAENPKDRCYHCKTAIFSLLRQAARSDGYSVLLDGTNASDDAEDRPGMRALTEMEVRSPLRECGLTKEEIRERSRQAGLFTWDKPAYACLATRIPTGMTINRDILHRVEGAEAALRSLGFSDFRVRFCCISAASNASEGTAVSADAARGAARIQVLENQFLKAAAEREHITEALEPFFDTVLLDFKTR